MPCVPPMMPIEKCSARAWRNAPLLEPRRREEAREHVAHDVLGHAGLLRPREEIVEVGALALAIERRQVLVGLHARDLADEAHARGEQADQILSVFGELLADRREVGRRRKLGRHRGLLYATSSGISPGPLL